MINNIVDKGIQHLAENKYPELLEVLALSLFIGGEDIFKYDSKELYMKLDTSLEYTNFRNNNTILSNDNTSFLVGELLQFTIKYASNNTKNGLVLTNIESLALPPTMEISGNTPLEILVNFDHESIVSTVRNSVKVSFKSEPILAYNKDDLFTKINNYTRLADTDLIFYIHDVAVMIMSNDYTIDIRIIPELSTNKDKIMQVNDLVALEELLGDNEGKFEFKF